MAESRRVKMTKKMIKEAFIEICAEKPISKVSVKDVCEAADVNRSTFYAHYEDVIALRHEIEDEVLSQIPEPDELPLIDSIISFLDKIEGVFDYVIENKELFKVLITHADDDIFVGKLIHTVLARYPKSFQGYVDPEYEYCFDFCFNGFIGILKKWIEEDFPVSSRRFAEIALTLTIKTTRFEDGEL
ncbi:MAG: TetR/AcrR family transcriptional regulator C-terminal domain-containing protein [Clostridia bacterium]|nr:TetR/AcrR family transcriptional regulator C-terminal domain-containing protein [Clostridia bacterium]